MNGPHEDGGLDLTHAVLGALLLAEVIIVIIGFADLRRRSVKHEGIQAATFLALHQLDEFVKSRTLSSSKPG